MSPRIRRKPKSSPPRPATARRGKSAFRPQRQPEGGVPTVRFEEARPLADASGKPFRRHYQLDTLAAAAAFMVRTGGGFILQSVHEVLGPAPVSSLVFELSRETESRLVFRLSVGNRKGRRTQLAFVVAKQEGGVSQRIAQEPRRLLELHERAPKYVLRPLHSGQMLLKGRPHTPKRALAAYITEWAAGYWPLAVGRDGQLAVRQPALMNLTALQTESVKAQFAELYALAYNPAGRKALPLPGLDAGGQLFCTKPQRGLPRLKLMSCGPLVSRATPARMIAALAAARWEAPGLSIPVAPLAPRDTLDAFVRALGQDTARAWLLEYRAAVHAGHCAAGPGLPLAALDAAGIR